MGKYLIVIYNNGTNKYSNKIIGISNFECFLKYFLEGKASDEMITNIIKLDFGNGNGEMP